MDKEKPLQAAMSPVYNLDSQPRENVCESYKKNMYACRKGSFNVLYFQTLNQASAKMLTTRLMFISETYVQKTL